MTERVSGSITNVWIDAKDGSMISVFYNKENDLLVIDKVKGNRGNEFVRTHVKDIKLPMLYEKGRMKKLKEVI